MSELVIFIIGALIFAVTVYGSVMAGGLALTRAEENALDPSEGGEPIGPVALIPPSGVNPIVGGAETKPTSS